MNRDFISLYSLSAYDYKGDDNVYNTYIFPIIYCLIKYFEHY